MGTRAHFAFGCMPSAILLLIMAGPYAPRSAGASTTVIEQISTLDYSQAPNGSYFPSFVVEEWQRWPRVVWPRGEAWSRRALTERAMAEIRNGAVIVMFASTPCALCTSMFDIFDELAVPVSLVPFSSEASTSERRPAVETDPDGKRAGSLQEAARQLPGSREEPYVFLGTRFLGDPYEVRGMLHTGELHGRLKAYGVMPRTLPPVNRAPTLRIQPLASAAEGERFGVGWETSWAHPVVWGRVTVTVLEVRPLVGMGFSYDPQQRKVVRGAAPTPGYPFGEEESNSVVEVQVEEVVNSTSVLSDGPLNHTLSLFPVRDADSRLRVRLWHVHRTADQLHAGDAPVLLGSAHIPLPVQERAVQGWYAAGGEEAGEAALGLVHLRVEYRPEYRLQVQQGAVVRLGGVLLEDADALNGTLRLTLQASRGRLSLPANDRLAFLLADPLARQHPPGGAAYRRDPRYGGLSEPAARLGFVEGDGMEDRRMVVDGGLEALQAALAEAEYEAPGGGEIDRILISVNDKGHTGQGGNQSGELVVEVALVEGARNQPPRLRLWPETQARSGAAVRWVPLGVEAGLHGLLVEDDDAFEGEVMVTVRAELGVVSVHGLGPWERGTGARHRAAEGVAEAQVLQFVGREVASSQRKGFYSRALLCSSPGGFADEFVVQGPTDGKLHVSLNDEPGAVIPGTTSSVRTVTIEPGGSIVLHHNAHDDFQVHYTYKADRPINLFVMDHANYLKYLTGEHFIYHPEASQVQQAQATVRNLLVKVEHGSRWYAVMEAARDAFKPGWRTRNPRPNDQGYRGEEGELGTGQQEEEVEVEFDLQMQRFAYSFADMLEVTGGTTPLEPTATAVCAWIFLDKNDYQPPPGLDALGIRFLVGDGHRDSVMRFRGPLSSVQNALGTLSYFRDDGDVNATTGESVDDLVHITVNDLGHTGAGGPLRSTLTVTMSNNRITPPAVNASAEIEELFTATPGAFWDGRVAEVREDSRWLDIALEPFAGIEGNGKERFGPASRMHSVTVPLGWYNGTGLAEAMTAALGEAFGDAFWECEGSGLEETTALFGGACASWVARPPVQLRGGGSGGRIRLEADEARMSFSFVYDAHEVSNGRYANAFPCELGSGPATTESVCGWWGGRFSLLFSSGPNRERSLARLLGFQPTRDYASSASQYQARVLARRQRGGGGGDPSWEDRQAPALLEAPLRYFVDLGPTSHPTRLQSAWGANRPPHLSLNYKMRAELLSLSVPPGSMAGLCHVRNSGVDYAGPGLDGRLDVTVGVGTVVNRYWRVVTGDVALRDYAFTAAYEPDPDRAQITYEWEYAVVVMEVELVMTNHGIVEMEGFVGGVVSAEVGHYRTEDTNDGWLSLGVATGSAGEGPFEEGARSVFRWPDNEHAGQLFRVVMRRSWHYKKWGLYRAFPLWRHKTVEVDGVPVVPRLARAVAGEETALTGVGVEDLDLGEDSVQAADLGVRRLTATLECRHGFLFLGGPDVEDARGGGASGFAARAAAVARGDAEALAVQGDLALGVSAEVPIKLAGNTQVRGQAWHRPAVPDVDVLDLASWRLSGGGHVHFVEGGGVADRRVVIEGRLAAIQEALRGLRYRGAHRPDPGLGRDGERVCTEGRMCGQASGSLESRYGGYGARGYDAILITVSDNGHSDRVCEGGGQDPLAVCELRPGAEHVARGVLEVTVVPQRSNQLGSRAATLGGEEAAFNAPLACLPCYIPHPADADLCLHRELYWGSPDAPGHAYRLSALQRYSEAQRLLWLQQFRKPCDLSHPVNAPRPTASTPGSNSDAHGDPSAAVDELSAFMHTVSVRPLQSQFPAAAQCKLVPVVG